MLLEPRRIHGRAEFLRNRRSDYDQIFPVVRRRVAAVGGQRRADNLVPSEGATVHVVTSLGGGWINDLTSEWIAPAANQGSMTGEFGSVTYDTLFSLPVGFTGASLNINLAADDWVTITLNGGPILYTGPSTGQWTFDSAVPSITSGFVAGSNTLEFIVHNTGTGNDAGGGPTGLDAQVALDFTPATAGVPEPSTALPLAALALAGAFVLRRRYRSIA
jgi:hypothetical protein